MGMPTKGVLRGLSAPAVILLFSCSSGQPYEGLGPAGAGAGPRVVFDPLRKPLPEIPFPNDVATRIDPDTNTGRRVNGSLVAPTDLERNVRSQLDLLDGFGTFSPITVAFDDDLDFDDVYARQNNADPKDDALYLINLDADPSGDTTVALDLNGGHYPLGLAKSDQYFLNDPLAGVPNLIFPMSGPFANFLHVDNPAYQSDPASALADLMTFYERSTKTLIVRPVRPLEQASHYAVVLTSRLRGKNGEPVRSPFSGINHISQTEDLRGLQPRLPPGTTLADVAFAWSFTTQSATTDLEDIHEGLRGSGPYSALNSGYPIFQGLQNADGTNGYATQMRILPLVDNAPPGTANYLLSGAKLREIVSDPLVGQLLGFDKPQLQALLDSLQYINYFVAGTYLSPDFLAASSADTPFDSSFRVDRRRNLAGAVPALIPFFMAIPKQTPGHFPPFPVAIIGHGYKSTRFEGMIGFAGTFAKFGVASVAIDAYGHGLEGSGIDPLQISLAKALLASHGVGAFADALFQGRARDLDNDGIPDSGGDFWTADAFHTRDVIRQSTVDWMQLVRLLRTFDGADQMILPDGTIALGADFNGDGIPDLGGPETFAKDVSIPPATPTSPPTVIYPAGSPNPGSSIFLFGQSLGGILCGVLPAVETNLTAAACGSTAGGLTDVVTRSTEPNVVKAALLEVLGPIVATCGYDPATGRCGSGPPTLVFDAQNVNREAILPIAQLALAPGDRVTVINLSQASADASCAAAPLQGCSTAVADASGRLRTSLSADWPTLFATETSQGDGVPAKVVVTVVRPGDRLSVRVDPASGPARVIDTWELGTTFQGVTYAPGAPLSAPSRGYGYQRNTPELRRLFGLSQMILTSGDPINYAPHWFKSLLPVRNGVPANVLTMLTVGDTTVPIAAGLSLARAAGLIETVTPDPDFGIPIDQVLIQSGVTEGLAWTNRYADATKGPRAALGAHIRCTGLDADCSQPQLLDPTGFSCGPDGTHCTDQFSVPRLTPPLREKLQVQTSAGTSALILEYIDPHGSHSFLNPHPEKPFDADLFFANLVGRYFATKGTEVNYDQCQQFTAKCPWIPPIPQ